MISRLHFARMRFSSLIMTIVLLSAPWKETKFIYSKNFATTPALTKRVTAISNWKDRGMTIAQICAHHPVTGKRMAKQRDVAAWIKWFTDGKCIDKFTHKNVDSRRGKGRRVSEDVYTAIKTLITDPAFETSGYRTLTWCVNEYIIENEDFFISPSTLRNYLKDFGCRMVLEYRVRRCFSQDNMDKRVVWCKDFKEDLASGKIDLD